MTHGRLFSARAGRSTRWVSRLPVSALLLLLLVWFPRPSLGADVDVVLEEITVLDGAGSPKIDFLPGEGLQVRVRLRILQTSGTPFVVRLRIAGDGWHDTWVSTPVVTTRTVLFGGPDARRFTGSGAGPGKVALIVDIFSDQYAVSLEGSRHAYLMIHCPEAPREGVKTRREVGASPVDMELTRDNLYLYVTSREDRSVTVIDTETKDRVALIQDPDTIGLPAGVAQSANGQMMYVVDAGYEVLHVIDADSQVIQDRIPLNPEYKLGRNSLGRLAVSPTRNEVYIADSGGSRIVVLDLASGGVDSISLVGTPAPPLGLNPVQVMLDPNPQFLYVLCNAFNEVIKLDVVARRIVDFVQLRDVLDVSSLWPVWSMALNPETNQIYVVANPGSTGKPHPTLETKIYVLPKDNLDARPRQEFRIGSSVWDLVVREDGLVYGIDSYRGEILIMDMSAEIELSRCAIPADAGGRHLRADFDRNRLFVGGWLTGFVDIVE